MIIDIEVPMLFESVSKGTLLERKKKVNETIARDETLIDIETDEMVLEVPFSQAGILVEIVTQDGETVVADQVLARIDTAATAAAEAPAATPAEAAPAAAPAVAQNNVTMPATTELAAETDVDVNAPQSLSRDDRILKGDVQNAAAKPAVVVVPVVALPAGARPEERVLMNCLHARVAERPLASQQENAALTTFNEVNVRPIMDLCAKYREKFEKEHGVKLGFVSFLVKAAVTALKKYPVVNAPAGGKDTVYRDYLDIDIVTGNPCGLVVSILYDANQTGIAGIEQAVIDYAKRVRDDKVVTEDLTGGTFSVTNSSTFSSMMSTPIINPFQSAILGMYVTKERAVVENDQIVVRPMMHLALSYDHRITDGREAILTSVVIRDALENPARLLLGL